jgi:energy-coupling factor transporter transmembrane protein EcfT
VIGLVQRQVFLRSGRTLNAVDARMFPFFGESAARFMALGPLWVMLLKAAGPTASAAQQRGFNRIQARTDCSCPSLCHKR